MKRVVPGIHSVREVFKVRPRALQELWLRDGELHGDLHDFLETARGKKIPVKRVSQHQLDREVQTHQGVIAFVGEDPPWLDAKSLKATDPCLIYALDGIEDPHNVGSLMRSAWNLGAKGMILPKDGSAGTAPSAQKVASGAFEHVPTLLVANLAAELKSLKDLGFWIYGLDETGNDLLGQSLASKAVLVVGSEESGLRKPVAGACDALIRIPQDPSASSFNASVAGAIVGFEFLRQRNLLERSKDPID